jgi:putative ABC transport system ATP-binding protein
MSTATRDLPAPSEAPAAAGPVLRVRGLNHWFGDAGERKQVLFDNNLEIMPGEIVIMTGPSGSGKTTLLTLLGGLRTVQDGRVEVLGRSLNGLAGPELVRVRRDIGFIFQAHNLFKSLTALQNVQLALELKHRNPAETRRRAAEVLTDVGLAERLYYKPDALSGGQKQRVAIARALANRPRLILADEPTAALDERSGRDVVELLKRLARERGCTSLIVTHDNRILDVANRIVSMVNGRIRSNVLVDEHFEICEFLQKCDVFARLTPGTLTNIAEKMARERHAAGAVIVRQGEEAVKFYLIKEGSVEVVVDLGEPGEATRRTLGKGEFFGERALMRGTPRTASVIAREDVQLYTLGKDDFAAALAVSEPFRKELEKMLFQRQ